MLLNLHILAQAIEDVLRFELGLPLVGVPEEKAWDAYSEALAFVTRYPTLSNRLNTLRTKRSKYKTLCEVSDARW
jgi:hypothetical protein